MKIEDLRKLSENDLKSRLIDNMESLQKYRFQKSIQQLEDYKLISEMKKENAKINTILKELSLSGENINGQKCSKNGWKSSFKRNG